MIKVECYPVGELSANMFLVLDDEQELCFAVDTGAPSPEAEKRIDSFGADKLKYILLTHGHFDHIGNTAAMKRKYPNVIIVIGEGDSVFTNNDSLNLAGHFPGIYVEHFNADIIVNESSILSFGNKKITVMETPGHTRGGVCYRFEDMLFTGDTIISGTTGRMDFPTGDSRAMLESAKRIAALEGNLKLFCGHGNATTLDFERKYNYAMGNITYDDLY